MVMEQFIEEIRTYAQAHGLHPSTVIQRAGCGGGMTWSKWLNGKSCTLQTADRLRRYMADNPASEGPEPNTERGAA